MDLTCNVIAQGKLSRAEKSWCGRRAAACSSCSPGKDETFDLILAPRFARLIAEFAPAAPGARLLPLRG